MREIKFRAWDKKRKKMFYGYELDKPNMIDFQGNVFETGNTGKLCDCGCSADYINPTEQIELMQFTGLRDKNGKEIYEGDIIQFPNSVKYIVDFHQGSFVYKNERTVYTCFSSGNFYKLCEVIGNIYENPKLLGGEGK